MEGRVLESKSGLIKKWGGIPGDERKNGYFFCLQLFFFVQIVLIRKLFKYNSI